MWDLGASICGDKAQPPNELLGISLEASLNSLELTDQPKALFGWQHGAKPNWMVSSRGRDPVFSVLLVRGGYDERHHRVYDPDSGMIERCLALCRGVVQVTASF